jgi:hypothetical protein
MFSSQACRRVPIVLALALLAAACAPARAIESLQILSALAAAEDEGPAATDIGRTTVAIDIDGRHHLADVFSPPRPARAALVLVPGAAPLGRNDPRLVAFAVMLARARFTVLVPEIPNLRALVLSAADAEPIGDAVRYHARSSGAGKVGLVAISYAAGPALLAALEPEVGEHVSFVLAVGGYYSVGSTITHFTTGYYRMPGEQAWLQGRPNPYGVWVLVRGSAGRLDDPDDRALMMAMAELRLRDLDADISALSARLGPEGRAILALLENHDPARVDAIIAALPGPILEELRALDLARRDLSGLAPRVILVHGRDDPIVPYTESIALADALPPGRYELHLVDNLTHVELRAGGLADGLALWRVAYSILSERDRMPAPHGDPPPLPGGGAAISIGISTARAP